MIKNNVKLWPSDSNGFIIQKGSEDLSLHIALQKMCIRDRHIGMGEGTGERIINPQTYIEAAEGSYMEMETTQIKGVDSTKRFSKDVYKRQSFTSGVPA